MSCSRTQHSDSAGGKTPTSSALPTEPLHSARHNAGIQFRDIFIFILFLIFYVPVNNFISYVGLGLPGLNQY